MSDDIHRKRAFVANMYPGSEHWAKKVRHMSDIQVTAIYLKEQAKPRKAAPLKENKNEDDIPF